MADARRFAASRKALRVSEERFRLLVESVRDYAIFMLDPEGHVATWNLGAERLKGYLAQEIVGQHFSRFYPKADIAAGKPARELEVAALEGRLEDEGWRLRKDGTPFWANVVITALRDGAGRLVGFAKVTRDLTERKRAEEERVRLASEQAARVEAQAAVQAREAFLARASHELRTPLTSALGTVRMIRKQGGQALSEPLGSLLEVLDRNLTAMASLINDLLDASELAAPGERIVLEPVVLADVVRDSVQVVAAQARERQIALRSDVPEALHVRGARVKLQQVLVNLLANAVKFTPPGGEVAVETAAQGPDAVIRVRDTGEGIAREHLERIFEPFYRVRGDEKRRPRGTGLGLTICRQIIALHRGGIWAESEGPGKGATFVVRLPAAP